MTINDLFEQHYSDQRGCEPGDVQAMRMSNGSYSRADIATDFRYFKAGYEAGQSNGLILIGYLSPDDVDLAINRWDVKVSAEPRLDAEVSVFVKQCGSPKNGEIE